MHPSLMSASLCDTCVYMIEFEAQNGLNHYDLRVTLPTSTRSPNCPVVLHV